MFSDKDIIMYFEGIYLGANVPKAELCGRTLVIYRKYKKIAFPESRWPFSLDLLDDTHFKFAFDEAGVEMNKSD